MMKFATYFITSVILMLGTIYYAYYTYRQFYPTVLFLVSSKVAYIVAGNLFFAVALLVARIFKSLFFGQLRDTEVELLVDTAKYTIPETCLALTIFRNELTPTVIALFASLIFIKLLHKLAKCRIEYLEQLLPMPIRSQLRAYFLLAALFFIDTCGASASVLYISTYGRSVLILFGFEFGLLIMYTINLTIRFVIQIVDSRTEAGLQSKGLYLMLVDMTCEIVKFLTYVCFFGLIFVYYGLPIHILRDVYMAFITCQRKVVNFIKYMQLTRNLDSRFEDATPEELRAAGNCLVCREELTQGKKLRCGHVFHLDCLRMWLQHQQSCPLCRANISVADPAPGAAAGAAAAARGAGEEGNAAPGQDGPAPAAAQPAAAAAQGAPAGGVVAAPHAPAPLALQHPAAVAHAPAPVAAAAPVPPGGAHAALPAVPRPAAPPAPSPGLRSLAGITPMDHQSPARAGVRVFGRTLPEDVAVQELLETFPRFSVVVGEPDVVVHSDPMQSANEVRRISSGTIIFVSARVRGGDGGSWLKAPDGWILEQHPSHVSTEENHRGAPLYAVVPLMGPRSSAARATGTALPSASVVMSGAKGGPATHYTPIKQTDLVAELTSSAAPAVAAAAVPSPSAGGFYSRSQQKSRLLDLYDSKPSAADAPSVSPAASSSERVGRAPFSSTIDSADETESSASPGHHSQPPSGPVRMAITNGTRADLAERLQELQDLLSHSSADDEEYDSLRSAVSAAVAKQKSVVSSGGGQSSLRRRHVAQMQQSMERVTQNLVELSQSVLECQIALKAIVNGEAEENADSRSLWEPAYFRK